MASREKRPLAPSKSKQKASDDSGLSTSQNKRKRALPNLRKQQLARDFLEAVAGGSQLSPKSETTLPSKKVLRSLRHKQKLKNAKSNLIKVKVSKIVPIAGSHDLHRRQVGVTKRLKIKKARRLAKAKLNATKINDQRDADEEVTDDDNSTICKISKNNLRTKKTKTGSKTTEETDSVPLVDRDSGDACVAVSSKNSPKTTRKLKIPDTPESPARSGKTTKYGSTKKNSGKDTETIVKQTRSLVKDTDSVSTSSKSTSLSPETKNRKKTSSASSTVDLTIEEVVASMVSDMEHEDCHVIGGKITRSRKLLTDEKSTMEIEIKKEIIETEDDNTENTIESPMSIQLRHRTGNTFGQRSLRNGKLRQLSDSGIGTDLEMKKRRWLNMDESNATESSVEITVENTSDVNTETEYSFSESSGNDNHGNPTSVKEESTSIKLESTMNFDEPMEMGMEMENNNNSERIDRAGGEVGPILRSKTKAKSTEMEIKIEDPDPDEPRPLGRSLTSQLEPRKSGSLDQLRKDSLAKLTIDKPPKSRRSSLNIDVKKTMSSLYSNEKSDNPSKSHIDIMIETIKLGIAKSIESKISRSEKSLVMSKNFEIPKIEEIVAPLSAGSQKLLIDESADDEKPNASKNDVSTSEKSDDKIPKVADTAKEIEKLVMGEIEMSDTRNSESAEVVRNEERIFEIEQCSNDDDPGLSRTSEKMESNNVETINEESVIASNDEKIVDNETIGESKDSKKSTVTRKSPRIKSSNDGNVDLDSSGKSATSSTDDNEKTKIENNEETTSKTEDDEQPCSSSLETIENREKILEKPVEIGAETAVEPSSSCETIVDAVEIIAESFVTNVEIVETIETTGIDEKTNETENVETNDNAYEIVETEKIVLRENNEDRENVEDDDATRINSDCVNCDASFDDSETLESISKEVERLVSEAASTNPTTTEIVNDTEITEPTKIESTVISENTSIVAIDEKPSNVETIEVSKNDESSESTVVATVSIPAIDTSQENRETIVVSNCEEIESSESTRPSDIAETLDDRRSESLEKIATKEIADRNTEIGDTRVEIGKTRTERNNADEQKSSIEENRRVLRARDKPKKTETKIGDIGKQSTKSTEFHEVTIKIENEQNDDTVQDFSSEDTDVKSGKIENSELTEITIKIEEPETPVRTRRSREVKRRKDEPTAQPHNTPKSKRSRRDARRSDQQNKEETLLDDEVATINENNRSLVDGKGLGGSETMLRGFSEGGRGPVEKLQNASEKNRSKSENDIEKVKSKSACSDRSSHEGAESDVVKENENTDCRRPDSDCKIVKTVETPQKDSDDASTSGESSSSSTLNSMIHETPEDKARKESILRLLGLESLEKAAERLNHQKAKKEQYTGTLKTVIRVQKNKDKKRSRSPLKMVLKQGRGDGDGDSPEFYTIQKEFGASGMGDSSSDENTEETPPKDRQSLVIPEKSASFSIHPGRCCADVCCHCGGKFGSLDTPMHLAQMKSDERRQKILNMEKLLNEDSCICDACYRRVDRKANTSPTNMQTKPHRQLMVLKCSARDCREPARHSVKRRWLQRIKARVHNQVDINWESSQHTSIPFCVNHYSKILPYLMCALCKRRLAKNNIHRLAPTETEELNQRLRRQGIPVHLVGGTFVCKHCRYFTQLQLKYKYVQNMNVGLRTFFKDYRIRMLKRYDVAFFDYEEDDALPGTSRDETVTGTPKDKDKDKAKKKVKCNQNKTAGPSKSPDHMTNSTSEKSTPEPTSKNSEPVNFEPDNDNRPTKSITNEVSISREVQLMDLETTVAKLKKRKALEQHVFTNETSITPEIRGSDVVEILAMDKEVTLTRLPKRPRVSSDITPVVQRLGANPSISVRTLFPGEEEMNLHANVEFANVREITPQGWEKCATMIQYDRDTKLLWQELQRPYGNQSSFLRHLILLEKYYRSGDLVLAPNASRNAINYSTSVQNRLISYEGPEKMDEPIMEPISGEYSSSKWLSGGYMMERDRLSLPGTSATLITAAATKPTNPVPSTTTNATSVSSVSTGNSGIVKPGLPRVLKLNSGVSIIKKPPPNLQRLNLPSGSSLNGGIPKRIPVFSGGKIFELSEPEFKRLQDLKRQKQLLTDHKQSTNNANTTNTGGSNATSTNPSSHVKSASLASHYQKAQTAAQTQFQKHLRMQQEMLNRQSRGDFEPLICDVRNFTNENTPTQNLLNNLNLPKSIQVTTKPSNPIPILPKIPKSLTVIPQTISRPLDK